MTATNAPDGITYAIVTRDASGDITKLEIPGKIIVSGDGRMFSTSNLKVEIDGIFGLYSSIKRLSDREIILIVSNRLTARLINHLTKTGWAVVSARVPLQESLDRGDKLTESDFTKTGEDSFRIAV